MRNARSSSIQDVAAAAGVSTATVSRVLNNAAIVAPGTVDRVRRAIDTLGYKPNLFAQGLMTRRSHVLGIALPDIHGEFYSEVLRGADSEARRLGYHLLVSSEAHTPEEQERGSIVFGLVDGLVVMISEPNEALWSEAKQARMPMVVVDSDMHDDGVDCILIDNASGTREAAVHLLKSVPAERCYFVGGPAENFDSRHRAEAFTKVLREHACEARPDQTAYGRYSVEWGEAWATSMLATGALINAGVLAGNDEIALGIMQTATAAGVHVPDEFKVIGFDDTRLASLVRPRMSSVRVPMAAIGAAAIAAVVRRLENPEEHATCVRLATKLVERESSGGKV